MYSNTFRTLLMSVLIFTIGCGIKLGEKNKTQNVAEVKGVSCVKESMAGLKGFLAGEATDQQVGETFDCLQKVILTFKENIRGKDKNSYTPGEIASFLIKNFLKGDAQFTPELLAEVMKFKVALIGGNTEAISKTEIDAISSLMARIKPEALRLNPHMKIITSKWNLESVNGDEKEAQYGAAKQAFNTAIVRLLQILEAGDRPYEINDLMSLAHEAVKFAKSKPETIALVKDAKELILKFKLTFVGGGTAIKGAEWTQFGRGLAEVYMQTLRIKYFLKPLAEDQTDEKYKVYEQIASDVLTLLPEMLKAKGANVLKNSEINELLAAARPLFPSLEISPDLVEQVGKVKLMLLGKFENGHESWSRADFINLQKKLPNLMSSIKIVLKNLKHYKIKEDAFRKSEIKHEDFLQAEKEMIAVVTQFAEQIVYSYDLQDLKKLIISLKPLLKDSVKLPENLDELFDVAYAAKVALTGAKGPQMTAKNIQLLLNVGIRAYGNYVEFANFVNVFKMEEKEFVHKLEPWVAKLRGSLALELALKDSHVLITEELTNLLLAVQKAKILTTKFQKNSLDRLFNTLWANILNTPQNRLTTKAILPGFNDTALQVLTTEVVLWIENEKSAHKIFSDKPEYTKDELKAQLKAYIEAATSPATKLSVSESLRVTSADGLLNYNDRGYLRILTPENGAYHVKDLMNSNLGKLLARLIIRSYSSDLTRIDSLMGITLEEIQAGFDELRFVLSDLDLIDPDNTTFIASRFRESNLFLAVSNGDDYSSFEEMHHLVVHILSGLKRAETVKPLAMSKCLEVKSPDRESQHQFREDCMLDLYLAEDAPFADMPDFLKLKTDRNDAGEPKYTPDQNKTYYLSLLKAAGHIQNDNKTVFLGDANLFPHVVQYIEMIYFRHDVNRNGLLEKDEALSAFPIFKNLITLLAKPFTALKEPDMPGVFIYLLKNGRPPKSLAEKLAFAKFVKDYDCSKPDTPCQVGWDITSTRHDLGKIFNFIADATKPQPPPKADEPPLASPPAPLPSEAPAEVPTPPAPDEVVPPAKPGQMRAV